MTRATTSHHSSTNIPSRSNGNQLNRSFKKSYTRDRGVLSSISLNGNHRNQNLQNKRRIANNNPFTSFQPNKSGIIHKEEESNEPSDFSHFLSSQPSSPEINHHQQQPQQDGVAILNATNSNSPCKNINNSHSNFISSQSRSNQNVTLKEKTNQNESTDDIIFAGLQLFNSMTVPCNDNTKPLASKPKNNQNHQIHKNKNPPRSIHRNMNESTLNRMKKNNQRRNVNTDYNKQYRLDYIPYDWCLKRSLYFVSTSSLDWCCNISLKIRNGAMHQIPLQSLQIVKFFCFFFANPTFSALQ